MSSIVRVALLLEHGCEKTHNNFFAEELTKEGADTLRFGWASIQLDGGITSASHKVISFFHNHIPPSPQERVVAALRDVRIGLLAPTALDSQAAGALLALLFLLLLLIRVVEHFRDVVYAIVGAGGTVVIPQNQSSILKQINSQNVSFNFFFSSKVKHLIYSHLVASYIGVCATSDPRLPHHGSSH